jgi:iron complex transport system substrate-binding protein
VLKSIWNALGDIRLAVLLLPAASATLLTGSFYAEDHFSLFMALNHMRIQDWLPAQWASQPELVWWIPVLFAIMALLGINTFICAANRFLRLIGQRRSMARGRFFYLLTPSLVHFLFITIMLGHLTTFTMGRWQRVPLTADSPIAVSREAPDYRVETIRDEFYPDTSALNGRLRQTAVTLAGPGGQTRRLQYGRPAFIDGRFLLLDRERAGQKAQKKPMPAESSPARRPGPSSAEAREASVAPPLLMIVFDPGLAVIILGLTLIMALMIGYFLFKSKSANQKQPARGDGPAQPLQFLHAHPGQKERVNEMKRQTTIVSVLLSLSMILAAGAGAEDRILTDMVGRGVRVPLEARRIVTTFKPASLCVTALGLQGRLVGIDTSSRRDPLFLAVDPALADLPAVGQKSTGLNFEAILAVKPDLVILFAQKDGVAIADRLVDHGVAAIVILPEKIDSLYATLRLIAEAAGAPESAEAPIAACRRVLERVQQRVASIAPDRRKLVYFAAPQGLFFTASGDLLQDEMIAMAGGINAGHDLSGYFREISPEQFIAWNPDLVLVSGHGAQRGLEKLEEPQFARVSAVAAGRIYRFPSNIGPWDFPSPLSALGVLWLAQTCYPEQFADVDLAAEIDRFHLALFGKSFAELGGRLPQ